MPAASPARCHVVEGGLQVRPAVEVERRGGPDRVEHLRVGEIGRGGRAGQHGVARVRAGDDGRGGDRRGPRGRVGLGAGEPQAQPDRDGAAARVAPGQQFVHPAAYVVVRVRPGDDSVLDETADDVGRPVGYQRGAHGQDVVVLEAVEVGAVVGAQPEPVVGGGRPAGGPAGGRLRGEHRGRAVRPLRIGALVGAAVAGGQGDRELFLPDRGTGGGAAGGGVRLPLFEARAGGGRTPDGGQVLGPSGHRSERDLDQPLAAVAVVAEVEAGGGAARGAVRAASGQRAQSGRRGELRDPAVHTGLVTGVPRGDRAGRLRLHQLQQFAADLAAPLPRVDRPERDLACGGPGRGDGRGDGTVVLDDREDAAEAEFAVTGVRRREGRRQGRCGGRGEALDGAHPPCVAGELALRHEELQAVRYVDREGDGGDGAGLADAVEQRAGAGPDRDQVGDVGDDAVQGAALGGGAVDARAGGEGVGGVRAGDIAEACRGVEESLERLAAALGGGDRTVRLGAGVALPGRVLRAARPRGRVLGEDPSAAELM